MQQRLTQFLKHPLEGQDLGVLDDDSNSCSQFVLLNGYDLLLLLSHQIAYQVNCIDQTLILLTVHSLDFQHTPTPCIHGNDT